MKKQIEIDIDNENAFNVAMSMVVVGAAEVIAITSRNAPIRANALNNKIRDFLCLAREVMPLQQKELITAFERIKKLLSLFH